MNKKKVLIKGIAASQGVTKGKIKIILTPASANELKKEEILVTEFTSPLYAPAILKASAIVTNTGGKLCHAAIIARELEIPCVVGAKNATKILRNGMEVIVDGTRGLICYDNK